VNVKRIIYFLITAVTCFACKSQQPISANNNKLCKVEYSNYGGIHGWEESLSITEENTSYNSINRRTDKSEKKLEKTSENVWRKLESSLDIHLLERIKSGESTLLYDGKDTKFKIVLCSGKEFSFINSQDSDEYQKMNEFFSTILDCRIKIISKINNNDKINH
jgi:hypothetical protein